jgi:hypothetical protein
MTYFNEAYVTERYNITTEELQNSIQAMPIGFPDPHIVDGEKVWAGEELTMWDTCRLLDRIKAHAEAANADLNALLDELYAL